MNDNSKATPSQPSSTITLVVLGASGLTVLANATISPSLPGLADAFADTPHIEALAGLVVSLPSLAIVASAWFFGWLVGRVERRLVLAGSMLLYALGGASGALAESLVQILFSRVLLGIGVAGTLTVATLLATELWTGSARARFMGWQGAAISVCGIVSLLVGGALAGITWRGPFLVYLVALPLALAVLVTIPAADKPKQSQADDEGDSFPWLGFAGIGAIMFAAMVVILLAATRLPFLLRDLGASSPLVIGVALSAVTVGSFPTGLFYGRVRARLTSPVIASVGLVAMGIGFAIISQATNLPIIILGALVAGLGLGLIVPNQNLWLMSIVPEASRGRAAGFLTTVLFAGQGASPLVSGALAGIMSLPMVFLSFALGIAVIGLSVPLLARGS